VNSNPYTVPAFIFVVAVLLACIAVLACCLLRPAGRHSRPVRRAHAATLFADPQDQADPDGQQYVEQITSDSPPPDEITWRGDDWTGRPRDPEDPGPEPRDQALPPSWHEEPAPLDDLAVLERMAATDIPDLDWWKQLPPPGDPLVEVLTGPAASIRQTSALTFSVLARVRDSLAALVAVEAASMPDDPDATRDFPAVTSEHPVVIP
jgi:hypothetical protein